MNKYLIYLTANDDRYYVYDFLNFKNMIQFNPGVEKIFFLLVISETKTFTPKDKKTILSLIHILNGCKWFEVISVIYKNNIGRDFSSAKAGLNHIAQIAKTTDYIMIKNRSGYGPLIENWYLTYITQFEKFEDCGLVGSTINLRGHPKKQLNGFFPHVQTYVYLSKWNYFMESIDNYPGEKCTDRLDVITKGEIGLSKYFLDKGLKISCLYWPDIAIGEIKDIPAEIPTSDIKKKAVDLPIRYKYKDYFSFRRDFISIILWKIGLLFNLSKQRKYL